MGISICLFIQQKNRRDLVQVGQRCFFPLRHGPRMYVFFRTGDSRRDAQFRFRAQRRQNRLYHFFIAVRCFDEKLRLVFLIYARLKLLEFLRPLRRFYRKVSVERKALPVESAAHDGHNDRRRPDERNDAEILLLRDCDDRSAGIGNCRASRFGNDAHGTAVSERVKIVPDLSHVGMLAEFVERERSDVYILVNFLEKPACRTHVFHDEVFNLYDNVVIVRGQNLLRACVAEQGWHKI